MRLFFQATLRRFLPAWEALAALFFMLFMVVPATVYYYNFSELTSGYWVEQLSFIHVFVSASCLLLILTMMLQKKINYVARALTVAAVYVFLVNFFNPSSIGLLDGLKPMTPYFKDKTFYVDVVLILSLIILGIWKYSVIDKLNKAALVISLAFVIYVFIAVSGAEKSAIANESVKDAQQLYTEFSRKKNIIVLSMDSIEQDVLDAVFKDEPSLRKPFEGFIHYTDVASFGPNTTYSLPTTLRGKKFKTGSEGARIETLAEKENQLMITTLLRENGYKVALFPLYNHVHRGHGDGKGNYFSPEMILGKSAGLHPSLPDAFQLTLLRLFPHEIALNILIGNELLWLVLEKSSHFSSFKLLQNTLPLTDEPVFKFYHYLIAHEPLMYDQACRFNMLKIHDYTFSNAKNETICVLTQLDAFIENLKKHDLYDNSMIIIVSDHGHLSFGQTEASKVIVHRWTASRYWPIVMIKPWNAHGQMIENSDPVTLLDVAPTICAAAFDADHCKQYDYDGVDLLRAKISVNRPRPIMIYVRKHDDPATQQQDSRLYDTVEFTGKAQESIPEIMKSMQAQ